MSSRSNYWLNPSTLLLGIWTITSRIKNRFKIFYRRQTDSLEAGLWCSGHWPQCGVSRPQGQCGEAQRHQHPQHQGHWWAGCRGVCVPGMGDGGKLSQREGISTLFPVSDLNTKWYSICAAHSERARYVQWIMRLWHDVTGRKRNTRPENGKGFSMQMNITRNEKCLFSLFTKIECSTPWLNSLSSWVFTDAAVARQLISPLSLNSLIPWIKWDKLQFVLSEPGNLSLLRTFDKTFNAENWKMMEATLKFIFFN